MLPNAAMSCKLSKLNSSANMDYIGGDEFWINKRRDGDQTEPLACVSWNGEEKEIMLIYKNQFASE